jgi:hypothetical protein
MEWTKRIPAASGFYWIKTDVGHKEIVRVEADETPFEPEWDGPVPLVYVQGESGEISIDQFVKDRGNHLNWYGPINPPD